MLIPASASGGARRARKTDDLIGADQKIPDWLIKIKFLGKVETSIRSGIKSKRQGPYGVSLIRRLIMSTLQMKNKITVICKTDQIAQMASCYLTGAYLLKAVRPPDSRPPAT